MEIEDVLVDQFQHDMQLRTSFDDALILLQKRNMIPNLFIRIQQRVERLGPGACSLRNK